LPPSGSNANNLDQIAFDIGLAKAGRARIRPLQQLTKLIHQGVGVAHMQRRDLAPRTPPRATDCRPMLTDLFHALPRPFSPGSPCLRMVARMAQIIPATSMIKFAVLGSGMTTKLL
jgi:hypothetical protein